MVKYLENNDLPKVFSRKLSNEARLLYLRRLKRDLEQQERELKERVEDFERRTVLEAKKIIRSLTEEELKMLHKEYLLKKESTGDAVEDARTASRRAFEDVLLTSTKKAKKRAGRWQQNLSHLSESSDSLQTPTRFAKPSAINTKAKKTTRNPKVSTKADDSDSTFYGTVSDGPQSGRRLRRKKPVFDKELVVLWKKFMQRFPKELGTDERVNRAISIFNELFK